MVDPFLPDREKVAAVREALPATAAGIYLDTATAGPLPSEAIRAMREIEDLEVRAGRGGAAYRDESAARRDEARAVVAALIGADPSGVALRYSAADAVRVALHAIGATEGDAIVAVGLGPGELAPVIALRGAGVEVRVVGSSAHGAADAGGVTTALAATVGDAVTRRTRAVVAAHVDPATGAVLAVAELATIARDVGAWLIVDGSQAACAFGVEVEGTGADAYAVAGETWALGPEGTGALWASPRFLSETSGGADAAAGHETLTRDGVAVAWPDARRLDAATFHRPSIVGLARTLGWLEMYVGLPWAFERAATLTRRLATSLAEIDGVSLLAGPAAIATIVSFRVRGWTAPEVAEELERRIFAIVSVVDDRDAVRASVAFFNTEDEVDRVADLVRQLARHTPASMPRRPTLIVLSER